MRTFKCDLNPALSIISLKSELWSWTLLSVWPHMNTTWWVWKNGLIFQVKFPSFSVSAGWCGVSVWETNLGRQSHSYFKLPVNGLQNCMLCWNDSSQVKW